ncbi:hypothetical protein EMCRGX_G030627 [Ephydatia muelleri]
MAFAPGHHNYHLDNTASFSLLKQLQCSLALSVPCLATPTSFDVVQCSLKVGLMTDGLNDHSTAVARRPSQNQLCFIKILRKNTTIMLSSVTEFGLRFFTFVTSIDRGNCSSGTCIPILNLAIQFLNISYEASNGTGQSLVAQQTTNLNLWFNISNSGQNAFAAVLTFLVLKSKLYFIRCDPNLAYLSTIQDYSPALFLCTCQVANPLPGGNYSVIAVRMAPTANIDVTQGVIPLMFNVSSQNPENQTTVQDNSVSVQMNITAASGLSVDPIGFCSYPAETPASETILGLSGEVTVMSKAAVSLTLQLVTRISAGLVLSSLLPKPHPASRRAGNEAR